MYHNYTAAGFYEIVTRKEAERRLDKARSLPDKEQVLKKLKALNVEVDHRDGRYGEK